MILKINTLSTKLGQRDHGRRMSLKAFEFAQVEDGYICELARGWVHDSTCNENKCTITKGTKERKLEKIQFIVW